MGSAALTALAIAFVTLRANLATPFGPIDDHEPLRWMGYADRVPFSDYLDVLLGTEVGQAGHTPRFRPAYYAFRVGQATILGDNPRLWYLSVMFVFAATITVFGYTTAQWFAKASRIDSEWTAQLTTGAIAVATTAVFGGISAWAGIVTRLGPSELPAMFGASLAVLGLTGLLFGRSSWWWLPALTGTWVAVLSKESFAPLVLLVVAVGLYRYVAVTKSHRDVILAISAILPAGILAAALLPGIAAAEQDVYGADVGNARLQAALAELFTTYRWYWLPAVGALILSILAFRQCARRSISVTLLLTALTGSVILWWIFDAYLYSGSYSLPRYWAVFTLLKTIVTLGGLALAVATVRRAPRRIAALPMASVLISGALTASLLSAVPSQLNALAVAAQANAEATQQFDKGMTTAKELIAKDAPASAMIVAIQDVDFEPVVAIAKRIDRDLPEADVFATMLSVEGMPTFDGRWAFTQTGSQEWAIQPFDRLQSVVSPVCIFVNSDPLQLPQCDGSQSVRVDARAM